MGLGSAGLAEETGEALDVGSVHSKQAQIQALAPSAELAQDEECERHGSVRSSRPGTRQAQIARHISTARSHDPKEADVACPGASTGCWAP